MHHIASNQALRTLLLWSAAALIPGSAVAQPVSDWAIDRDHSSVAFEVLHLGLTTVRGEFGAYDATVQADAVDGRLTSLEALVIVGSLDTGRAQRDEFLMGRGCFHALGFPVARLVTREIRWEGDRVSIDAFLTLRGITRPLALTGTLRGPRTVVVGDEAKLRVGYRLNGTIARTDYELCTGSLGHAARALPGVAELKLEILLERTPSGPAAE